MDMDNRVGTYFANGGLGRGKQQEKTEKTVIGQQLKKKRITFFPQKKNY